MLNVMGIINLKEESDLKEITHSRSIAAVPIGGRYRVIDFLLSNFVNSGMRNVGVITQTKFRSLMDHLRSRKEWDLNWKDDGLFILSPVYDMYPLRMYRGDLDNFHTNMDYLNRSKQEYVIITGGDTVCNINYKQVFEYHKEQKADITMIYKDLPHSAHYHEPCHYLKIDKAGRVLDIETDHNQGELKHISMDTIMLKKSLLIEIVNRCVTRGEYDLLKDGLIKNLGNLQVKGYKFDGFMAKINTVQNYFRFNMDLLNPSVWEELFFKNGLIYTKVKDEAPAKYFEDCKVSNSLIANGCMIEGTVENSIIFRGVKVHKGAHIKNSIIMQKSEIGHNTHLDYVILDKDTKISMGKRLSGDMDFPIVIAKKTVI